MKHRNWFEKLGAGLKAFRMGWSGMGGYGGGWAGARLGTLPGSAFDYEAAAGDPLLNGAVSICLGWLADNFPEPDLRVVLRGDTPTTVPGSARKRPCESGSRPSSGVPARRRSEGRGILHPFEALLRDPNPFYDGDALWAATAVSYAAHGNAYWIKARGAEGEGRPLELWHVPHWQIEPRWPADGSEFISHYVYRVNGREHRLERRDVVHFRFGLDPQNPRLGMSRLRAVLREIVTDNEASTFMAALLRNMAIPGVLISPVNGEQPIGPEVAEAMKREFMARYGGEGRGEPLIPGSPVRVDRLGLTPEELVLDRVRQVPEARICGALRLPAMVVGLSVGEQTRSYANYAEARRAAYEDCLMPMQRRFARALQRQLLPDLGDPEREEVAWDYSRVAAMRDDLTEVYRRAAIAVSGGWMRVNEARALAALPPDPGGDTYLRPPGRSCDRSDGRSDSRSTDTLSA